MNVIYFYSGQDNDINLMKACWNELFALGLAQCSNVMNVGTILSAIINHLQTSLQEGRRTLSAADCLQGLTLPYNYRSPGCMLLRGKQFMPCRP